MPYLAPLVDKHIAEDNLSRLLLALVYGKDKVQVGMRQSTYLLARGAYTARVAIVAMSAEEVLHVGKG
jgi:hypothetical protein